jgi:Uncharacterized protein conserved in bacteria
MITPSNIILNKGKTLFTITFDGVDYPLTTEYLRVYSPSAEVVGHGSWDKKLCKLTRVVSPLHVLSQPVLCGYFVL